MHGGIIVNLLLFNARSLSFFTLHKAGDMYVILLYPKYKYSSLSSLVISEGIWSILLPLSCRNFKLLHNVIGTTFSRWLSLKSKCSSFER